MKYIIALVLSFAAMGAHAELSPIPRMTIMGGLTMAMADTLEKKGKAPSVASREALIMAIFLSAAEGIVNEREVPDVAASVSGAVVGSILSFNF